MRERSSGAPARQLKFGSGGVFGDEFDGGVRSGIAGMFGASVGEKYSGVLRDAEKSAEREAAVRQLAQKMLSRCCHEAPAGPRAGRERRG